MVKAILLKYISGYVTPLLKILPCLPHYEWYKPEPWRWSAGPVHSGFPVYSGLPDLFLTPSLAHFHWTQFLKHAQHMHTSGPLHYLSPLTRRALLSLIFPIFHSLAPCKSLFNSHHLKRQHCPIYLKLYSTPSPHTPNYLLFYSIFLHSPHHLF